LISTKKKSSMKQIVKASIQICKIIFLVDRERNMFGVKMETKERFADAVC